MAKFCVNCGNEMANEAVVCVKCGTMVSGDTNTVSNTPGKKKGLPTWAIVLIIVGCVVLIPLIILLVIFVIGYNATVRIGTEIDEKFNKYIEENKGISDNGTIGDTLIGSDFKITLTDINTYDSIGDGYYVEIPEEENEYLLFFFEIENISDEKQYISSINFEGYVDEEEVSSIHIINSVDGLKSLSSTIASGETTRGFVAFEVDKTWKEFELHYLSNILLSELVVGDDLLFKVFNSN